jgi:chloramphenicol-sensitive protein RarD
VSPGSSAPGGEGRLALAAGALCYGIWGFVPLVFQQIGQLGVGAWEILAHRTLWAVPTALLFVHLAGQWGQLIGVLTKPRVLAALALSAVLIGTNWVIFIDAVNAHHVMETSLGYYITPLLNMAAGALLFQERIDRIGAVAMGLAVVGVGLQTAALGHLPIISLTLGLTFGAYGVVRKMVAAEAQTGLLVECLFLAAPGLVLVLWMAHQGTGHFGGDLPTTLWLLASGPITAVPLVLFSWAARRIPLSVMGFLQFTGPTISFGIGLAEGEAFTPLRALSFAVIWTAAAVFTYGAWRRTRDQRLA